MEHNLLNILLFSVAAACGAFARLGLSTLVQKLSHANFPWGIFVVNILGCFGFGLVLGVSENIYMLNADIKAFLLVGFMGSFTTFSTFIFDCDKLLNQGFKFSLFLNILGQIALGLLAFSTAVELVKIF